MIHGRMRASKPKTMQDTIEIATKLRNKKISTLVECQTANKKRLDNTSKNNQNQQQANKRQNTGKAYTARHGEKKHYGGSKPLCSKCNYHHDGPCAPKCHQCNRFGHLARDSSNEELKEPMEDQPLPANALPTALSPSYVIDSNPEKDEKDPKEDPAYYHADRGNDDDDESSNDDDDDDDVVKDEEDKEEEEHLALADPSDVSTDNLVPSS
nr:reverse transcriptase domain-containing protein [Tanacetum cinerariifolium]